MHNPKQMTIYINKLGTKETDRGIFKLAKMRERKGRDLDHAKCIKSNYQKALVKDNDLKKRGETILINFYMKFV